MQMFIGLLIAAAIIVLAVFLSREAKSKARVIVGGVVLAICAIAAADCYAIVPTGYSGIRSTFGQVSEESVPNGVNLKIPFIQGIALVNNKQQDFRAAENEVWGETKGQVQVYAKNALISSSIVPEKSAYLYSNYNNKMDSLIDEVMFESAFKRAVYNLEPEQATNRAIIEPDTRDALQAMVDEKYGEGAIKITQVVINQMDFEESYNTALAERNAAAQKQQQQAIENETNKQKAEADAEIARTTAQGKADSEKIEAQGKAEANSILSNSVTDKTLQQDLLDKWNGQLPSVVTGQDGLSSVFDVSSVIGNSQSAQ